MDHLGDVASKTGTIKPITNGGVGAELPAARGHGRLGANSPAAGQIL